MPLRQVIHIDEEKCDGCGLCVPACNEGAIQIIDGKAKLVSDRYCDGLGDCLGHCPQGAINIVEREAEKFDEEAVKEQLRRQRAAQGLASEPEPEPAPAEPAADTVPSGCPGARLMNLGGPEEKDPPEVPHPGQAKGKPAPRASELGQWPVQLALVPPAAPYFQGADLVVAADCVPFAYPDFHRDLLAGQRVVVGCPKLDDVKPYIQKLAAIIAHNDLHSVTVAIMEVPCCSGLLKVVQEAMRHSGQDVPLRALRIGIKGELTELELTRV